MLGPSLPYPRGIEQGIVAERIPQQRLSPVAQLRAQPLAERQREAGLGAVDQRVGQMASQDLPDCPYAAYANSLGLKGIRVDQPEQLGPAWDEAFRSRVPVVYEAVVDPEVPPLPPHITLQQAKGLSEALLKGEPSRLDVVRESMKQTIAGWIDRISPGDSPKQPKR